MQKLPNKGMTARSVSRNAVRVVRHLDRNLPPSMNRAFKPLYNWTIGKELQSYRNSDTIFKIVYVNVDDISKLSSREMAWESRSDDIGSVIGGEWDRDSGFTFSDEALGRYSFLHVRGGTVEEWTLYESIQDRVEGKPWESTELYNRAMEMVDSRPLYIRYTSQESIERFLRSLDRLIANIREHGLLSNHEYAERFGGDRGAFERLRNEILVDIGRDGSLFFVDGKHRLCIAKSLGISKIPVAFVARHPQWVADAEQIAPNHPDLGQPNQ